MPVEPALILGRRRRESNHDPGGDRAGDRGRQGAAEGRPVDGGEVGRKGVDRRELPGGPGGRVQAADRRRGRAVFSDARVRGYRDETGPGARRAGWRQAGEVVERRAEVATRQERRGGDYGSAVLGGGGAVELAVAAFWSAIRPRRLEGVHEAAIVQQSEPALSHR